jgi:hypothetical protein
MPLMPIKSYAVLFLLPIFFFGCASPGCVGSKCLTGLVFTRIKIPYTKDLDNTQAINIQAGGKIICIKEPVSGLGLYAAFNSNAIGEIAKRHSFKKVYFADLELFNILGIYKYEKLYIYGE